MIDFQIENDDLKNQQLNQHFTLKIESNWLMTTFQKRNEAIYIGPTRNAFSLEEIAIFFKIAPTYFHRGNEREEHSLSNNCHIVPLENSLYR